MSSENNSTITKEERRRVDAFYWAGVLIWAGLVFGADSLGYLPRIGGAEAWSWVFLGAGVYGLLGSLFRLASPGLSDPTVGDYVWPAVFLIIGLAGFTALKIAWPLILVLVGVAILASTLLGRK